tara:strand:+ start:206 stop:379 length:174 start_codon:yes stop_codon:yes gene_type:complete
MNNQLNYTKQKFCVECGDTFMIYHKAQDQKKYCGYPCSAKAERRRKAQKEELNKTVV